MRVRDTEKVDGDRAVTCDALCMPLAAVYVTKDGNPRCVCIALRTHTHRHTYICICTHVHVRTYIKGPLLLSQLH